MSHSPLQPAADAFRTCMCDLDELHPTRLAMNLFSKRVIDETYLKSIQESMKSTDSDKFALCSELLMQVYTALKEDAKLYPSVHETLKKFNPNSAKKFETEMSK